MARVFSGIQPSGELHIGNYLGAVRNWVALQETHECLICIVDYHAITQPYEPAEMEKRAFDMAVGLLVRPATRPLGRGSSRGPRYGPRRGIVAAPGAPPGTGR